MNFRLLIGLADTLRSLSLSNSGIFLLLLGLGEEPNNHSAIDMADKFECFNSVLNVMANKSHMKTSLRT